MTISVFGQIHPAIYLNQSRDVGLYVPMIDLIGTYTTSAKKGVTPEYEISIENTSTIVDTCWLTFAS